jgi:serine/threonine protein kinase
MDATAAVHPPDGILQSFGLGKLDEFSSESVGKHVEVCDSCQRRVVELSSDEFLGRLQQAQGKPDNSPSGWSPSAASSTEGTWNVAVPPAPADTLPPELVDHADYEVVRELGRGGMGVVYLVKNRLMGRLEVLKIIGRHLVERPGVVDRFLREIRSAAKLQHPNIVTAYTAMRLGEGLALAMEYVDGFDLAKMVKTKGALPIAHASYFIQQAALGLQHAHERGMVHRDVKPANLILARDGKKAIVKVLDFGLAKVTSEGQSDSNLTREGQMLGTPDYIAPEQIRNAQSADIRADIYSLGCTFYYLLSGGPPFRGDHLWDVYQAHFSMDAGPLNLVRPEVPVELAAVVAKMMAKEPGQRFQTPGQVALALTPFLKMGHDAAAGPKPAPELSVGVGPDRSWEPPSVRAVTTEPVARSGLSRVPSQAQPTTAQPEPGWETLINLREHEGLIEEGSEISETERTAASLWASLAAVVLVCTLVGALALKVFSPATELSDATKGALSEAGRAGAEPQRGSVNRLEPHRQGFDQEIAKPLDSTGGAEELNKPPQPAAIVAKANPIQADATTQIEPKRSRAPESARIDSRPTPMVVDVRSIRVFPGIRRLPDADATNPAGGFWPSLSPENLDNWQIGNPKLINMSEKGVRIAAGTSGNLLLTSAASYRKCTLTLTLAAMKGTEAFLVLQARRDRQGWHAVTARIFEENGKIRVGHQAIDFKTEELGAARQEFAPGKLFGMRFDVDEKNVAHVIVKGVETSSVAMNQHPADQGAGAVGVFVKSGTILIERLGVQAK